MDIINIYGIRGELAPGTRLKEVIQSTVHNTKLVADDILVTSKKENGSTIFTINLKKDEQ